MAYFSEQNVLKYNLFKALNDNREIMNMPPNKRIAAQKHGTILLRDSVDKNNAGFQSFNMNNWQENHNQLVKQKHESENIFSKQLESKFTDLQSPVSKKSIEIHKAATQTAYLRIKQKNQKDHERHNIQQNSMNSLNSTQQNSDIHFSYSRTLSNMRDFKLRDYGKTVIKKLIEKQNNRHLILPKHQGDQRVILQKEEHLRRIKSGSSGEQQKSITGFDLNTNRIQNMDQNVSSIKTYESIQEIPQITDREREQYQTIATSNQNNHIQESKDNQDVLNECLEKSDAQEKQRANSKSKYPSSHPAKLNQNINHNSNCVTSMGSQFMMRHSAYESLRNEDPYNSVSNQFVLLSSRKKVNMLSRRNLRQNQRSLRELSPEMSSHVLARSQLKSEEAELFNKSQLNKFKITHLNSQNSLNLPQANQQPNSLAQYKQNKKKAKNNLQPMQFYALPTNQSNNDQNYSSQFQNVRIPISPQYVSSPSSVQRTKSITLNNHQINSNICTNSNHTNSNNRSGVHTPSKISAKFRQALKESIERHQTRENEQIAEIKRLFSDQSAQSIAPAIQLKEEILPLQNYNSSIKNTPSQQNKKQPQQVQPPNSNQNQFNNINTLINSRQDSLETYFDQGLPYNYYIQTEGSNNNNNQEVDNNKQILDAKSVFENLPLHQQLSELSYLHKAALNSSSQNLAKFIFSQHNFKRRNQPQPDKKIFKV